MYLILNNIQWMSINITLALIPLFLSFLVIKFHQNLLGFFFFVLWLMFFPNTIYLITDIRHLSLQIFPNNFVLNLLLIGEYLLLIILGVLTYFYSLKPLITLFTKNHKNLTFPIIIFNFCVSFGVALGAVQRTESWDIIFNSAKVASDITNTLASPSLIIFVIFFGILINLIWFACNKKFSNQLFHL